MSGLPLFSTSIDTMPMADECRDCPALDIYKQYGEQEVSFSNDSCREWADVAANHGIVVECGFVAMLAAQKGMEDRPGGTE